jgi:16S rRNA C967 or C1407 C5-methylase (RsmB/RsmF family)
MKQPSNLLIKLSKNLFEETNQQETFIDCLLQPQRFNPAILWLKEKPEISPFLVENPLPWQPDFIDRLDGNEKPGKHLLHQQGYFYCLDFSSIFAASVLLSIPVKVSVIVDTCAAPGGKSIFAWNALKPDLILSNEVIRKRIGMIKSNFNRCQISPSVLMSLDSEILADKIPETADLVIVDAPCSGQSLLAKGEKNPGCFHPVTIKNNASRQKRIIANSAKIVAPQGYLAYMTCTYSPAENEEVVSWLMSKFPHFEPVEVPHLKAYQSNLTNIPCYRMWPQDKLGAGAFTVLLKNCAEGTKNLLDDDFLDSPYFIHFK